MASHVGALGSNPPPYTLVGLNQVTKHVINAYDGKECDCGCLDGNGPTEEEIAKEWGLMNYSMSEDDTDTDDGDETDNIIAGR